MWRAGQRAHLRQRWTIKGDRDKSGTDREGHGSVAWQAVGMLMKRQEMERSGWMNGCVQGNPIARRAGNQTEGA